MGAKDIPDISGLSRNRACGKFTSPGQSNPWRNQMTDKIVITNGASSAIGEATAKLLGGREEGLLRWRLRHRRLDGNPGPASR
jgi:hypothetical protein